MTFSRLLLLRLTLLFGLLVPLVFWISTFIASNLHDHYNHCQDTVSQLGALGAPSHKLMTMATWLFVGLALGFGYGVYRVCWTVGLHRFPVIGVAGFIFIFAWAALFPSGHSLHGSSGPALLQLMAGPLSVGLLWKGNEHRGLRSISWVSLFTMLLLLLRVLPFDSIRDHYTGLIQRFVHLGWSIWFVGLGWGLLKRVSAERGLPST